nr:MAG: major capsid protein [Microvirus sp.]
MAGLFQSVKSVHPGRSVFNLSYEKKFTADMGQLIPVMCDEVVPGDKWQIGNQMIIRFQPLVAPILHEVNVYVHYFFVPYRLLWSDWENFITGGKDGAFTATLPRWTPTSSAVGSLWDYMGMPTGVVPVNRKPLDFPKRAYNFIYNHFYRDETLVNELDINVSDTILRRAWEKDYFTSSLPWQQRGTAPALPITGTAHAVFQGATTSSSWNSTYGLMHDPAGSPPHFVASDAGGTAASKFKTWLNFNNVDLSAATTFNVSDLRLAFQVQKWLERNARGGYRYTEFLRSHFGVSPRDDRLQRPEYIGGTKSPVIISEVLQTSGTTVTGSNTPQGNMAGHGLSVNSSHAASYYAQEFGVIVGLMSVMPRTAYQQGINRQWLRQTKYDFYFPEFANLSEQAIEGVEVYASATDADNTSVFGYQGRYDELRYKPSQVCAQMRDTYDYWHLGRQFTGKPLLNQSFIDCVPRKDVFAAPSEPAMIVQFGNLIKAVRPLPQLAEPGLIDHN